jgi:hypothetical protein
VIRFGLTIVMAGAAAATPPAGDQHHATPPAPAQTAPAPIAPGFAAVLAERPFASGPAAWHRIPEEKAWAAIMASSPDDRQDRRWSYAGSLIAQGRGAEALGVLQVMHDDDDDLLLVPAWRRARGVAAAQIGHAADALAALGDPALLRDPESCFWRLRMLVASDQPRAALAQFRCARPALGGRDPGQQRAFVTDVGTAAVTLGLHREALAWLAAARDGDPAANLLRGKASIALGNPQEGRLRLARAAVSGNAEERAAAQLGLIETRIAAKGRADPETLKQLDHLIFSWRGGAVEHQALRLSLRLAEQAHDTPRHLAAGAALFRYVPADDGTAKLVTGLQAALASALAPTSRMPVDQAAGLFWDYRDLAPAGSDGDRLAEALVNRLMDAGLYARAADLLQFRLAARALDVEQGPLSVRIASLRILAGTPAAAVRVIRSTDATPYPADMRADRRRVEAAALDLLGKSSEALAALSDVPDAGPLRAEIYWRARDWAHLAEVGGPALPAPGRLSPIGQAVVLRHAIALAMLGREEALARLRGRYAAGFASLPTAPAFALLTGDAGATDPTALGKAMAALPSASPSGAFGDLLENGSAAMQRPAGKISAGS